MLIRTAHLMRATGCGLVLLCLTTGCGSGTEPPGSAECGVVAPTVLAIGEHRIIDPSVTGDCLALPAAGAEESEYLVVVLSANGDESAGGISGSYSLTAGAGSAAALHPPAAVRKMPLAERFHARLREREREQARAALPSSAIRQPSVRLAVPPAVGSLRTFKLCASAECTGFVDVPATARYVGAKSAIYVDNTVPDGGYTAVEVDSLGILFDTQLYPIDTLAFGRESDIDGNGVVAILLSDQVNALSSSCLTSGEVIVGYFFGLDLTNAAGSNHGEVFYSMVPDPGNALCFGKNFARRVIGPTFIHEFQHMISYNRHVLLGGGAAEDTWLNEGLSHFAEELGGRRIPGAFCTGSNCLNQFAASNLRNASLYLQSPISAYLVEPGTSSGSLAERGANWLFVRWLADRSPDDSLLGTGVTRRLLGADQAGGIALTGGGNVTAAAGLFMPAPTLAVLLGEWHLANYAESIVDLPDPSGRLHYASWNLRAAIDVVQPGPYPLRPPSTAGQPLAIGGRLLGGSADFLRVLQPVGGGTTTLTLTVGNRAATQPHLALLRLR